MKHYLSAFRKEDRRTHGNDFAKKFIKILKTKLKQFTLKIARTNDDLLSTNKTSQCKALK